ncbi:MAG TPA: hypothetical protein VGY48_05460 [Vicinamibacterales bacterium]|nr:hypothetical protein [Vicinamibacterales bacterium]
MAILAVAAFLAVYTIVINDVPIRSDGYSYYVYLPSWLLYRDATLEALARDWYGGSYPAFSAIARWPGTGYWLNAHPIGEAILMAPFFGVGHLLTRWANLPPDGFSFYYQYTAGLAGLTYFVAGLALLRRVLLRHFAPRIALATLVAITFGTNLFHYGVYESTFSHAFSFFLITLFLDLTDRWWTEESFALACALGVTAALVFLTRHTNALFLLMLPLWGVSGRFRLDGAALWNRRGQLTTMVAVAAAGALPQLLIYRRATGSWIVSSYGAVGAGFTFASPHLYGVLFSTQKGLFFWSPILLLAVAGLPVARGWARRLVAPTVVIFVVNTYLIASWSDWQFGASYGHRGFTDGLGVLAVYLATFFSWASERPRLAMGVGVIAGVAVLLSTLQMLQYWFGILPIADTTWEQYRSIFLRLS